MTQQCSLIWGATTAKCWDVECKYWSTSCFISNGKIFLLTSKTLHLSLIDLKLGLFWNLWSLLAWRTSCCSNQFVQRALYICIPAALKQLDWVLKPGLLLFNKDPCLKLGYLKHINLRTTKILGKHGGKKHAECNKINKQKNEDSGKTRTGNKDEFHLGQLMSNTQTQSVYWDWWVKV